MHKVGHCPHPEGHESVLVAEACDRNHVNDVFGGAIPKRWDYWSPIRDTWSYDAALGGKVLTLIVWGNITTHAWKGSARWGENQFFAGMTLSAKDEAAAKLEVVTQATARLAALAAEATNAVLLMELVAKT